MSAFPSRARPKRLLPAASMLAAAGLLATACAAGGSAAPAPSAPQIFTVATTAAVTTWDPVASFSTEALYMANMYEGLLRANPPGSARRFSPLLATSWHTSANGLTWTFQLRHGVKFSDGEAFDATAAKLSIEAAARRAGASFIWAPLKDVVAAGPYTLRLDLKYAAPMDLIASSAYGAWMVAPKALTAASRHSNYFEKGISAGTGPYELISYTPDQQIVLSRFRGYWGGWKGRHPDKIVFRITPEAVQQQEMLQGGEVDLALRVPDTSYASFRSNPAYHLVAQPSWFNYVAFFNVLRPPLNNALVRRALSYAMPYQQMIKVGALGYASQSRGAVPRGVYPYSASVPQYRTDLARARQLLAQAGHPGGHFTLTLTYAAENELEARIAPLIKDSLAQAGVTVNIKAILFNQQWAAAKSHPSQAQDIFLLLYWPTYADAGSDNLHSMFHSASPPFFNLSYWSDKSYDHLIDTAQTLEVTSPARAQALYNQAQNLLVSQAPAAFLMDTQAVYVVPEAIHGFRYNENYPFSLFFYGMSKQ